MLRDRSLLALVPAELASRLGSQLSNLAPSIGPVAAAIASASSPVTVAQEAA